MGAWLAAPEWDEGGDAWFCRSIGRFLEHLSKNSELRAFERVPLGDVEIREAVVEWYLDRRPEFTSWEDDDGYEPEFPCGSWQIDGKHVSARLADAVADVQDVVLARRDAKAFPSLELWLAGLHAGSVAWKGPTEREAWSLLDDPASRRHGRVLNALLKHWPRLCRSCGREYRYSGKCRKCHKPARTRSR